MRTLIIKNEKLKTLLGKKTEAVIKGRELTEDIEVIEAKMADIDKEVQAIENKVEIGDLNEKAQAITTEFNSLVAKMEEVKKEIYARIKTYVPVELTNNYEAQKKIKDELEIERNKLGLKINKYKDLIIPLTQKSAKPLLEDEYEDFSDVRLEDGEVVIDIFSHLEDWKEKRKQKLAVK